MGAGHFASAMMRRFAPWWLYGIGILAILSAIAGLFFDLRVSLVGLFVILILIPQALAFTYYSHALCRECFVNTTPHSVEIRDGMLVVSLYVKDDAANDIDLSYSKDNDHGLNEWRFLRDELFSSECIKNWSIHGNAGIAELHDRHKGFLWIPAEAFDADEDFNNMADFLREASYKGLKHTRI